MKYPYFKYFPELVEGTRGIASVRKELILAAVCLCCFLAIINNSWKASPDGALYLELGESIARGIGYKFNGEWHTYVPPGFPFLVSIAAKLFGPSFLAYRALMALIGLATAFLGYMLVLRLLGRDMALVIGGLFAINNTLLLNSTYTTSDTLFTFVSLIAVVWAGGQKREYRFLGSLLFGSVLTGLPALIRVNGWGLPVSTGLFLFSLWSELSFVKRAGIVLLFVSGSCLIPLLWTAYKMGFPVSMNEGAYLSAVAGRDIGYQCVVILGSSWDYVSETATALAGVSIKTWVVEAIVVGPIIIGFVSSWRRGERLFTYLTAIQFGGLTLSSAGSRYILLLIPGLLLFLFQGVVVVLKVLGPKLGSRISDADILRKALVVVFCALLITNLGQDVVTIIGARSAVEYGGAESNRDKPFFVAARWLKANADGEPVLTMNPRILRYLTGLETVETFRSGVPDAIPWLQTKRQITELIKMHKPGFVFLDNKNPALEDLIVQTARSNNYEVDVIPEASYGSRYSLARLIFKN